MYTCAIPRVASPSFLKLLHNDLLDLVAFELHLCAVYADLGCTPFNLIVQPVRKEACPNTTAHGQHEIKSSRNSGRFAKVEALKGEDPTTRGESLGPWT